MMETKANFQHENLSKYMSTADESKFVYGTIRSPHKTQSNQFTLLAKSLRNNRHEKTLSRSKISSQQMSTYEASSRNTKFNSDGIHVVEKLKDILKNQKKIVQNFREWTESQKLKVEHQFEGFKLQMNNFIQKHKLSVVEYIDKFYIQLLADYKQLQNMARKIYSNKIKQKDNKSKAREQYFYQNSAQEQDSNEYQINNYGLISHLQKEKQTFGQYNQVKSFYQFHIDQFQLMAKQINKISQLIETDSLKQLTLQCEIKQFQNHLYHSMKQINGKLKWDRQPLIQIDISCNE